MDNKLYVALYDYQSRTQGDLPFNQGDLFEILQADGDWWMARHQTTKREGYIPSVYVAEYNSINAQR